MRPRAALVALVLAGCAPAAEPCRAADGGACERPAPTCPPPGPGGTEVGDTLLDLELPGCDAEPVRLRALCGAKAGLVATFYGWCPTCYDMVRAAAELDALHRARGLRTLVVVVQDTLQEPATADYCRQAREHFGLPADAVARDPDRSIEVYGTTDLAIVVDADARIVFRRRDASPELMRRAVEQVLAAP